MTRGLAAHGVCTASRRLACAQARVPDVCARFSRGKSELRTDAWSARSRTRSDARACCARRLLGEPVALPAWAQDVRARRDRDAVTSNAEPHHQCVPSLADVAENWWREHRSRPEYITMYTALKLALSQSGVHVSQANLKCAREMLQYFMDGANQRFVRSRVENMGTVLASVKLLEDESPLQYCARLTARIRTACPSESAFEFADTVVDGLAVDKEPLELVKEE
ncbi:hypothetical protein RI054_41g148270 [Pseudoscourfieldia marina]